MFYGDSIATWSSSYLLLKTQEQKNNLFLFLKLSNISTIFCLKSRLTILHSFLNSKLKEKISKDILVVNINIEQRQALAPWHCLISNMSSSFQLNTSKYSLPIRKLLLTNNLRMERNLSLRKTWYYLMLPCIFSFTIMSNYGYSQSLQLNEKFNNANLTVVQPEITKENIGNNQILISYHHVNDREISPYEVNYQYVQTNHLESVDTPMKSFLRDMDMYLDEGVSMIAIGDDIVHLAKDLAVGQQLSSAKAKYDIIKDEKSLIQYQIELNERKVVGTELMEVKDQKQTAFVIQSSILVTKSLSDGTVLESSEQMIQDWFMADYGIVKRRRMDIDKSAAIEINYN